MAKLSGPAFTRGRQPANLQKYLSNRRRKEEAYSNRVTNYDRGKTVRIMNVTVSQYQNDDNIEYVKFSKHGKWFAIPRDEISDRDVDAEFYNVHQISKEFDRQWESRVGQNLPSEDIESPGYYDYEGA